MIDLLTNALLLSPIPIQYTGNYCSHKCVYCFANINNPKRKTDIAKLNSLLKNYKNRSDLTSYFMREKYPIIISNNIDPFSKSNQPFVNDLIYTLKDLGIPVVLATRGGVGTEILKDLSPTVLYVSIPYDSEEKRQKYEPHAPSLEQRYELIDFAIKQGHKVICSINPFNPKFAENPIPIAEKVNNLGVKSILINKLHLTSPQQANLTDKEKAIMGEDLLIECKIKGFTSEWLNNAIKLHEYTTENEMNLIGFDSGLSQSNYIEFKQCYTKLLPTIYDWFNWCALNKKENEIIYFEEFYNFFSNLLPNTDTDLSKYIVNRYNLKDKDFYKTMDLRNILHLLWEHPNLNIGLAKHFPVFSYVKKQYSNKLDYLYDNEHNKTMIYTPYNFNTNENFIIE
jgi:DNA repair photolyase